MYIAKRQDVHGHPMRREEDDDSLPGYLSILGPLLHWGFYHS